MLRDPSWTCPLCPVGPGRHTKCSVWLPVDSQVSIKAWRRGREETGPGDRVRVTVLSPLCTSSNSYNPFEGPNENPEAELPLTAGEYIYIYGNMDEDGFFEGRKAAGPLPSSPSSQRPPPTHTASPACSGHQDVPDSWKRRLETWQPPQKGSGKGGRRSDGRSAPGRVGQAHHSPDDERGHREFGPNLLLCFQTGPGSA